METLAIRREVFDKIQWNDARKGQDTAFNKLSLATVGKDDHHTCRLVTLQARSFFIQYLSLSNSANLNLLLVNIALASSYLLIC